MAPPSIGPSMLRILDALLGLLDEGDVDRATAAWAVDLLLLYVNGIALEQSAGYDPVRDGSRIAAAITTASPTHFPHVHAARKELLAGPGSDRFSWAIDVLLLGVLQGPAPRPAVPTSKPEGRDVGRRH